MTRYDIAIIGAGPGGYVAALYAAGFGKKVLVIEKGPLGGVCLNWGCIPTKTLMASADMLGHMKRAKEFGIDLSSFKADYATIKARKDSVVEGLKKGIEELFKAKKIELKRGRGRLLAGNAIEVGGKNIEADNIIIATGSRPAEIPGFRFDGKRILSSADILDMESLPKKMLIIGGGVNGCEYAYTFNSLGVEVTLVELLDRLLPTIDREPAKLLESSLKKAGVRVMTRTKLSEAPSGYDRIVVCVGRKGNIEDLGLEEAGVKAERGRITVDNRMETNAKGIYAIGDVVGGHLLAHVASREGIVACRNIMGRDSRMDYSNVPLCIYTDPEIALTGLSPDEARERGIAAKTVKFPFRSLGKARAIGETVGFVKLTGDPETGRMLGAQIVGHKATELIAEASLAVKQKARIEDLCDLMHAHPTLSEAVPEAAYLYSGYPVHSL
jgi:dihydrolipoamide dehydrogenase